MIKGVYLDLVTKSRYTPSMTNSKNTHGGKRDGAGRQSRFGEDTKVVRVPISQVTTIKDYLKSVALRQKENIASDITFLPKADNPPSLNIPLYVYPIAAGFPSPAEDYIDHPLDLHEHFIKHPASTFYARAIGDSMNKAGIFKDSIMAIDKSLEARDGDIVVAAVNNEFTVKRFNVKTGKITLCPESDNPSHKPIHLIEGDTDIIIWGVVVGVFNKTR